MHITLIGCGNMGGAIAQGLASHQDVFLFDRGLSKAEKLQSEGFGKVCPTIEQAYKESDILILAIKPQNLEAFVAESAPKQFKKGQILISILSGVPLNKLRSLFPNHTVIRMMPNLAVAYGKGLVSLAAENLDSDTKNTITTLCEPLGKVYWLPESKFNAFTSLAGCGPAFILGLIEAITEAGIAMGFNSKDSLEIVNQMMEGTLALLENEDAHPAELKWKITSPGGVTIAGIRKFEEYGVRSGIMNTFLAAYERIKEIENK